MKTGWPESSFIQTSLNHKKKVGVFDPPTSRVPIERPLSQMLARASKPVRSFRNLRGILLAHKKVRDSINKRLPLSQEILRNIWKNQ